MMREQERNQLYNAIDSIQMTKNHKDRLRESLIQSYEELSQQENILVKGKNVSTTKPGWKRYVVAAVFMLCLVGLPVTTYAAYHYQWFSALFKDADNKELVLEQIANATNLEKITAETEQYKVTLLANVCSQKQKMGMMVCSVTMKEGNKDYFWLSNVEGEQIHFLTKEGIVKEELAFLKGNWAEFRLSAGESSVDGIATSIFCNGELAEDGGYLVGIRYSAFDGNMPETLQLVVCKDDEHRDVIMEIDVPGTEELSTATFQCNQNENWQIVVSSIGITFTGINEGDELYKKVSDTDGQFWWNNTVLQMEDGEKTLIELGRNQASEEMEENYSFYQEFATLIDEKEVKKIQVEDYEFTKIK